MYNKNDVFFLQKKRENCEAKENNMWDIKNKLYKKRNDWVGGGGGGKSKYKMQNIPLLMEKREKHTEG